MIYMNLGTSFRAMPLPKEAQMSSIEDLLQVNSHGKNRLFFVGNYLDYTTELGQSAANSGGILSYDSNGNFEFLKNLPLPLGLNSRKIIDLDENKFLTISNNDEAYTFELIDL